MGESIFTEADSMEDLHKNARDAVLCHFDEGKAPRMIGTIVRVTTENM